MLRRPAIFDRDDGTTHIERELPLGTVVLLKEAHNEAATTNPEDRRQALLCTEGPIYAKLNFWRAYGSGHHAILGRHTFDRRQKGVSRRHHVFPGPSRFSDILDVDHLAADICQKIPQWSFELGIQVTMHDCPFITADIERPRSKLGIA